jgi:hypothetical protein
MFLDKREAGDLVMKVSSASITVELMDRLVTQGYEVVVDTESEFVDIHKPVVEDQPNVNSR